MCDNLYDWHLQDNAPERFIFVWLQYLHIIKQISENIKLKKTIYSDLQQTMIYSKKQIIFI